MLQTSADGRIKLYLTHRALELRRARPALFSDGAYLPLQASRARHEHVVAFARALEQDELLTVAPRLSARLAGGRRVPPVGAALWDDTLLLLPQTRPGTRYRN